MYATTAQLARFLVDNPHAIGAYNDSTPDHEFVRVLVPVEHLHKTSLNKTALGVIDVREVTAPKFRTLICRPEANIRPESHVACQNEPIELGTQIQPTAAPWVGTAGLPVKWIDSQQTPHWGILSNWHVMVIPPGLKGHTQHQPDDRHTAVAKLSNWAAVSPTKPNHIDAALADALIDGFHTIADCILQLGCAIGEPIVATPGLEVVKSGRTTGVTFGKCEAVGAAVRVGYGSFEAVFVDQDIFRPADDEFSAAGDSGSAILGDACRCPCSLLFAGNDALTVGNPMRYIIEAFNLQFPFC